MKTKIALSMLVILFVVAASLGATFAWFTDATDPLENTFQAGTVIINAEEDWEYEEELDNWNPGDCTDKEIKVWTEGTKTILLRAEIIETLTLKYEVDEDGYILRNDNGDPVEIENPETISTNKRDIENITWKVDDVEWFEDNIDDWFYVENHNAEADGYWYYDGTIEEDGPEIIVLNQVCLDEGVNNEYQGAVYTLSIRFEAIQASNNASGDAWGVNSLYDPAEDRSSDNWDGWDYPENE